MTKNQLIKKLQKIPGNPIIVCSQDAEGNGFSELYELGEYYYDVEGEILNLDEIKDYKQNWPNAKVKKTIVLWPD